MYRYRYFIAWGVTTLLYVGALVWYLYTPSMEYFCVEKPQEEKVIEMALAQFVPQEEEIVSKEEPIEESPAPEEKPEESKEPPVKEPVVEEKPQVEEPPVKEEVLPLPTPVVKKTPPKKPQLKVKRKKVQKRRHKKRSSHKKRTKQHTTRTNLAKQNRFLAKLKYAINRAKHYPRMAQKRGMQGVVNVTFTILKSGRLGQVSLKGSKVFYRSARRAVAKAFPLNVSKIPFALPKRLSLSLHYRLQ